MKVTKRAAGWYATEDGRFHVVRDDYEPVREYGDRGAVYFDSLYVGGAERSWTVVECRDGVDDPYDGTNVFFAETLRECKAWLEGVRER